MEPRIAPIGDAERKPARAAGEQHALRAEAAVDDATAVRVLDDLAQIAQQRDRVDSVDRAGRHLIAQGRRVDMLDLEPRAAGVEA